MNWFESKACASRRFCRSCRSDQEWRRSILKAGRVAELDFACPFGIVEKKGLGDLVAAVATPIARVLKLGCVDPATKQLRKESGCAKRKRALNGIVPRVL